MLHQGTPRCEQNGQLYAVDPGNWATDLAAGSAYGYDLLCAILLANVCAIFFQVHIEQCAAPVSGTKEHPGIIESWLLAPSTVLKRQCWPIF
jgi:hypothetical protein